MKELFPDTNFAVLRVVIQGIHACLELNYVKRSFGAISSGKKSQTA